jgi:DNA gyrase subunit A
MAKRTSRGNNGTVRGEERPRSAVIEAVSLAEATRERYLNYALSVITSRALPDVRDGLKPVQRRILYAMWHDLHVTADGRFIKCAAVVGEVMKSYHPHGDQSIYDALVRMAQPFSLRYPLVEGYGNFGSIDGDPPAAMRYTESKLMPMAHEILGELRDRTVDMRPNYASTTDEPVVLPAQVPNLLINGAAGIAVGMATNIPPHNLGEVCKALLALLDHDRDLPLERLLKSIQGPRLPDRRRDPEHGRGDPADLRDGAGDDQAPRHLGARPGEAQRRLDHLDPLRHREGRAGAAHRRADRQGAGAATDERQGPEHRRRPDRAGAAGRRPRRGGAGVPVQEHAAADELQRQPDLPAAGRRGRGRRPRRLDLKSMLLHFLDFRMDVVTRRLRHELENLRRRIHILEGFAIVFNNLDEAIRIIRSSDGKPDAAPS